MGKRGDKGLEESGLLSVSVSELVEDLVVSGLDLGESNTVNHVLDQLNTLFESGDLDLGLVIFISPLLMLSVSFGGTLFDGFNGLIVVLVGLIELLLRSTEDIFVIGNRGFKRSNGLGLILDLLNKSTDGLVTSGLVGLVVFIILTLIGLELSGDFVQKKDDFLLGSGRGNVQGNSGDESLTEVILINLS